MKISKLFDSTSKILTWIILFFYISIIITSIVLKVKNIDIEFVLGYLQQLMIIIIVSYFGKSTVENFEKIRLSEAYKKSDAGGGINE